MNGASKLGYAIVGGEVSARLSASNARYFRLSMQMVRLS
jgi:hypothetical protein